MDCEHFDHVVLDWLYDELGEIESAASQRHVAHCTRCRRIASQLRAARTVGLVPQQPSSEDLFNRVVEAERAAQAALPVSKRLGRFVSVIAGWSMRPQLAMGALLLLMIGSSLAFLRVRPGDGGALGITESGVPEQPHGHEDSRVPIREAPLDSAERARAETADAAAPSGVPEAPESAADAAADGATVQPSVELDEAAIDEHYDAAMALFRERSFREAREGFELVARSSSPKAPHAALLAARTRSHSEGCAAAIPHYEALASSLKQIELANEALWLAAECERDLKRWDAARPKYEQLRTVPSYGARADQALQTLRRAESVSSDAGPAPASTTTPAVGE